MTDSGRSFHRHAVQRLSLERCSGWPGYCRCLNTLARHTAARMLLVFAVILAGSGLAHAATLTSNVGVAQDRDDFDIRYHAIDVSLPFVTRSQKFTTGSNATGYTLSSVEVYVFGVEDAATVRIRICEVDSDGEPDTSDCPYTLTNPATYSEGGWNHVTYTATAMNTFTAPANATLEKDTDYFAVFDNTGGPQGDNVDTYSDYWLGSVFGSSEDSGGAAGWSIGDGTYFKRLSTDDWSPSTSSPFRIRFNGTVNTVADTTAPTLSSATVNGMSLVLTYDEALDEGSEPAASAYSVSVAGTATTPSGVDVSDKTVTLTLGTAVTNGQAVTVSYTKLTSNPVQDVAGNNAVALTNQSVTNNTPVPNNAPEFATSSTTRSFPELVGDPVVQTAANVGAAITATDDDSDTLIYTMEGPGAGFFTIDSGDRSDQNQGRSKLRLRSAGGYLRVDGQGRRQQGRHGHDCSDHLPHGRGRGAAGTGSSCSVVD